MKSPFIDFTEIPIESTEFQNEDFSEHLQTPSPFLEDQENDIEDLIYLADETLDNNEYSEF